MQAIFSIMEWAAGGADNDFADYGNGAGGMRSAGKLMVALLLAALAITAIRVPILYVQKPIAQPKAEQGVLDLRGWTLPQNRTLTLNGEWAFSPLRLVHAGTAAAAPETNTYLQVPGAWESAFPDSGGNLRYGTYRLRILTDDHSHGPLRLRATEIGNASAFYVNGRLAAKAGHPSDNPDMHRARKVPVTVTMTPVSGVIDIVIAVSSHAGQGGILETIRFGTPDAVSRYTLLSVGQQLLLLTVLLIHGLYSLIMYMLGAANRGHIYFSLVIVCGIGCVVAADDRLLFAWLPMPYEATVKIALLSYIGVSAFIPLVLEHILQEYGSTRTVRWFAAYCGLCAAFVGIAPSWLTLPTMKYYLSAALLLMVVVSFSILQPAVRKQKDVVYLLISCVCLGANILLTVIGGRVLPYQVMHYPYDLIFALFAFAAFWFKRFFRSVAQTRELAEELRLAGLQKDAFLVTTSHELRNPLHGILNIAQLVLDDPRDALPEAHKRKLEVQVAVARRLTLLLDDLLDAARLRENDVRLRIGSVSVQSVATGVAEIVRHMYADKPVRIRIHIDGNFPPVRADENRLTQIMFNLLHNAMKFTDEGEVTVRAELRDGMAVIQVTDTGIGMDDHKLGRLFIPYDQGHADTSAAYGGLGLGLSISKRLVELHKGELRAASSPGQGSAFTFTLPLSAEPGLPEAGKEPAATAATEAAAALAEPYASYAGLPVKNAAAAAASESVTDKGTHDGRPRILAVDDDSVNLRIMRDMLGELYDVTTARSGPEALAKLNGAAFDLILLDVMMPHMSGYELTRIIRERYTVAEVPILLLTARTRPEDIAAGFLSGANDYLTKPVDALELKARLQAWSGLKRAIEERLRMEAAWLQAQIQPHFLFNTINSIAALGTIDMNRMQTLLEHFSNYLRMSFDFHNADRIVPVDRELSLVRYYLYIEKERFGGRMEISWELEPGLRFELPPLSVQTLVENAVNHGIMRRAKGGTVRIRMARADIGVEVAVSDDGAGMDEEEVRRLLDPTSGSPRGIGLRNTDRRLRQLYGSGLNIASVPDEGTTVKFRIPDKT